MKTRINIGYDGSKASECALTWGMMEAELRGSAVRVVTCFEIPLSGASEAGFSPVAVDSQLRDDATQLSVETRGQLLSTHPTVPVTAIVSAGPATLELIDGAHRDDVIVVGASNKEGISAFLLGSTPRYLVRHSPCPVVIARGDGQWINRVVVGVDGSDDSTTAMEWAADEAQLRGVELVVVHAWSYPYAVADLPSAGAHDTMRVDAACVLERQVEIARQRTSANVVHRLVENPAVPALLDVLHPDDLLVLGSRGRGALRSALFGSTANLLIESSPTTVVVVPHAVRPS